MKLKLNYSKMKIKLFYDYYSFSMNTVSHNSEIIGKTSLC